LRKVVYSAATSLDGYIAGPAESLDFLHLRPSNYSMGPFFKTIDVGLMGRKTYDAGVRLNGGKFESFGLRCYIFFPFAAGERRGAGHVCPRRAQETRRRVAPAARERHLANRWRGIGARVLKGRPGGCALSGNRAGFDWRGNSVVRGGFSPAGIRVERKQNLFRGFNYVDI